MTTASYSFYSKKLNDGKYNLFHQKATLIKDFKNTVSKIISDDLLKYLSFSKFDLVKKFGTKDFYDNGLVRGNELQKAVGDVFEAYENKSKQVKQKLGFCIQKSVKITFYKRKVGTKKKGDVRTFEVKTGSTALSRCLTFLAKYGSDKTPEYVERKLLTETDKDKLKFYTALKDYIKKFDLERLLSLGIQRRERVLQKYNTPIEFKSLSYRSALQTNKPLIQNSKNTNFCNAFIDIIGFGDIEMFVPTKFNIEHQGHLNQYKSKEYVVCVEQKRKRIRVVTTKKVKDVISPDGVNYLGVDTNIKHCLFSTSDEKEIDFDREIFNGYVSFLRKHQNKKIHTKGEDNQYDLWQERILCMLKKKASDLVDQAIKSGKDHIVMEDLSSFGKSFIKSEEFEGFKYSRLCRLLNLSSLNKIVKGICKKKGVRLTLIHSHYTSQWCFHCGNISRENRKTQETFLCVCCNHTANADFHSSQAISLIGSSDVLRSLMLVKDKSSDWIPKTLSKEFIRIQLEDIITKPTFQLTCQRLSL